MGRRSVHRGRSRRSFVKRAGKTEHVNMSQPLRGGWRL